MNTAHSLQSMPSLYHSSQQSAQHSAQQQLYEHPGGLHEEIQESAVEKLLADMQLQVGSNEFAHHK
jgi:hypothetical protein